MLVLSRIQGEGFYIYPDYSKVSPTTTLGELFGDDGHMTITITENLGRSVKVGIEAPKEFAIIRTELEEGY